MNVSCYRLHASKPNRLYLARSILTLLLIWQLILSSSVFAADEEVLVIERPWDFGIGIGFGELTNPFINSDDVPAYVNFDIAYYGEKFFFDNGNLGYTLIDQPSQGLHLIANYSSDRIYHSFFNDLSIEFVQDSGGFSPPSPPIDVSVELPDRDFTLNAGIEYLRAGPWGEIQTSVTQDILSKHGGQEASLLYTKQWQYGRWGLAASAGAIWKSSDLVDYYYGLPPQDAPIESISYEGRATLNTRGSVALAYRLTQRVSLIGKFAYERLGNEIVNSPLIERDNTQSVFLGVFFHF